MHFEWKLKAESIKTEILYKNFLSRFSKILYKKFGSKSAIKAHKKSAYRKQPPRGYLNWPQKKTYDKKS